MKAIMKRYILVPVLFLLAANTAMAQELNSAYFTKGYLFRHNMNPAFDNEKFYVSMPALGNLNLKLQGNLGVEDVLFKNPTNTGKKTVTFMHPSISYEEAMKGINDKNKIQFDLRMTLLSVGFKGFKGYNTIEVNMRNRFGLNLPGSLFQMAKGVKNQLYNFDFGLRDQAYVEIALGHSHKINENLRVGAKAKVLLGVGMAELEMKGLQADFRADQNTWQMHSGNLKADVYMKGLQFKNNPPGETFKDGTPDVHVDFGETDVDSPGISGSGGAFDLGGEYRVMDGLTVSASILDLGFINWSNRTGLKQQSQTFTFDGFKEVAVKDENKPEENIIDNQADDYSDQLSRFINLNAESDGGSQSKWLSPTINVAAEYEMPFYRKLTVGLLAQHHFDGDYSWSEARLSANVSPVKVFSFSATGAVNSFGGSFGWVAALHNSGLALFIGMDHVFTKTTKESVPLRSNANVNFGMNISF